MFTMTFLFSGCIHHNALTPTETMWYAKVFFPYTNSILDGQYKLIIIKPNFAVGDTKRYDWRLDPTCEKIQSDNSYKEVPIGGLTVEITVQSTDWTDNPVIPAMVVSGSFNAWATTETGEVVFRRIY